MKNGFVNEFKINGCWRNINDGGDNVIVITLEVIFYTTVVFEIKNIYYQL